MREPSITWVEHGRVDDGGGFKTDPMGFIIRQNLEGQRAFGQGSHAALSSVPVRGLCAERWSCERQSDGTLLRTWGGNTPTHMSWRKIS